MKLIYEKLLNPLKKKDMSLLEFERKGTLVRFSKKDIKEIADYLESIGYIEIDQRKRGRRIKLKNRNLFGLYIFYYGLVITYLFTSSLIWIFN